MRTRSLFLLFPVLVLATCTVDVPDIDTNTFACETSDDCVGDYTCFVPASSNMGRCVKSCSTDRDCPSGAPVCSNSACIDPCVERQCWKENGQACVRDGSTAICKPCNQANHECGVPDFACVVEEPAGSATCASASGCNPGNLKSSCGLPNGEPGRCVSVGKSDGTGYVPVCASCAVCTSSECHPAGEQASSLEEAIRCGPDSETNCIDDVDNDQDGFKDCADTDCSAEAVCQLCESSTECAPGKCVLSQECRPSCDGNCGMDSACVLAKEYPTNAPVEVCKTCASTCNSWEGCVYTGAQPPTADDYANIPVSCKSIWYEPSSMGPVPSAAQLQIAIAFDNAGSLYVASTDTSKDVHVNVLDSSGMWSDPGQGLSAPSNGETDQATDPAIVVDLGTNRPHVAWVQPSNSIMHVYSASLNQAGVWWPLGVVGTGPGLSDRETGLDNAAFAYRQSPAIGVSPWGPFVVWHDKRSGHAIDGSYLINDTTLHWESLEVFTSASPLPSARPSLAASSEMDRVTVAWQGQNGTSPTVQIRARNGTTESWRTGNDVLLPVGSDSAAGIFITGFDFASIGAPSLILDNSTPPAPLLAFEGVQTSKTMREIFVVRSFNAGTDYQWQPPFTAPTPLAASSPDKECMNVSLGFIKNTPKPRPIIAYQCGPNIHVRHLNNLTTWDGLAGSDVGSGLSGMENAASPKLAVHANPDNTSTVCVAWLVVSGVTDNVRIRCFRVD